MSLNDWACSLSLGLIIEANITVQSSTQKMSHRVHTVYYNYNRERKRASKSCNIALQMSLNDGACSLSLYRQGVTN